MTEKQTINQIIELLKENGFVYNDADFCRKTGLKASFVSEMKTGKKPFTESTLRKIEETFPDFFYREKSEPKSDIDRFLSIIEADHQLIREMVSKKDEEIDRLLAIMEADRGIIKKAKAV